MTAGALAAVPAGLDRCLLARFAGQRPPDWLRRWLDAGLAGVVLFAQNIESPDQLRALVAELRAHREDLIVAVDEEGGLVSRLEARTGSSFPGNSALGAVDDPELTRQIAASIGGMLAAAGLSLDLAPVADLDASPVIGVRSFGADPVRAGVHTAAFVRGLQDRGVAACAKHFPGHGRAAGDSHLELPEVSTSLATLRESDLVPFRSAIEAGVRCVMTAHVLFPAVDSRPATLSARWLTGVLREELGFSGVVITDALDMAAIGDDAGQANGAVSALAAGADLLCLPADQEAQLCARDAVAAAVRAGSVASGRIEEAAARVGELTAWTLRHAGNGAVNATADRELGLSAARRALVAGLSGTPGGAPFVLDAGWLRGSGVGESAASLLTTLQALLPGTDGIRLSEESAELARVSELICRAGGRPLVLVVRDARRRPWQRDLIATVLAARPDAIVVGTGGDDRHLAGASYLGTRGPARANVTAAAELLAGLLSSRGADSGQAR
jgi:beta-N-acetylhexosaminidase